MLKQEIPLPQSPKPAVFLIALGQEAKHASFALLHQLRQKGIVSTMDFSDRKMNKIMQYANHVQATYVAVIGDNELKTGIIELKEMASGEKQSIPLAEVVEILGKKHV